jgi:predicted DCC family thiol-disulfide oxidoreductase YuxK
MKEQNPIILFDGVCNLCNGTVDFLLKHDSKKQFRFASIQSEAAQLLFRKFQIPAETDSVILIKSNKVYFESDATIEIAGMLSFPWKMVAVFRIIPKKMRDNIYRRIAKNRYRWFGKRDICRIPAPMEKDSFIL